MITMQAVVLMLGTVSAGADPNAPSIGPLDAQYRVSPRHTGPGKGIPGWVLGGAAQVGDFVVVALQEVNIFSVRKRPSKAPSGDDQEKKARRPWCPVLIAINLRSGTASQLAPAHNGPSETIRSTVWQYWGTEKNRCMVVVTDYQRSGRSQWREVGSHAWEWDLERNTSTPRGTWTAESLLSSVLDRTQIDVKLNRSEPLQQYIELQDRRTMARTSLDLMMPNLANSVAQRFDCDGDVVIPQRDRISVVRCRPPLVPDFGKNWEIGVECYDPKIQGGKRWLLRASDIEQMTGDQPFLVQPVRGILPSHPCFGLYTCPSTPANRHHLLLIDGQTANLCTAVRLPFETNTPDDLSRISDLLVSPNAERVAYFIARLDTDDVTGNGENAARRKLPSCELMIVNVKDGAIAARTDFSECYTGVDQIFASDFQKSAWVCNSNQIRKISIGKPNSCEDVFTLEPKAVK